MAFLLWLIGGISLAAAELLVGDFALLMLGVGALGAAGAAAFGFALWVQLIVFALVSVAGVMGLRPAMKRRLLASAAEDPTPNTAALVGTHAVVIEQVTPTSGQIKLDGSLWSARTPDPHARLLPGDRVIVGEIRGTIATVWKDL